MQKSIPLSTAVGAVAGGTLAGLALGAYALHWWSQTPQQARSANPEENVDPVFDGDTRIAQAVESGELERIQTNTGHQRETLLFPMIAGDVYDRQRCVDGWDTKNTLFTESVALVVGTGGVGCNVAFALARMGVGTLILVDMDTVDATNLNRQILFSKYDVGKRKVNAARDALLASHALTSNIEVLDLDVIRSWEVIVLAAKRADVIFNCIDYGGVADKALASLAYSLQIPYAAASTYGNIFQNEFYSSQPGDLCWREASEGNVAASPAMLEKFMTDRGATVIDATLGAAILRDEFKVTDDRVAKLIILWMEEVAANDGLAPKDFYDLIIRGRYDKWVDQQLHPQVIQSHDAIDFIPYDPHDTRGQGSWVVVCTVGTLLTVNLWAQHVLGYPTIASSVCDLRHFDTSAEFGTWSNFHAFAPAPSPNHPWSKPPLSKGKEIDDSEIFPTRAIL